MVRGSWWFIFMNENHQSAWPIYTKMLTWSYMSLLFYILIWFRRTQIIKTVATARTFLVMLYFTFMSLFLEYLFFTGSSLLFLATFCNSSVWMNLNIYGLFYDVHFLTLTIISLKINCYKKGHAVIKITSFKQKDYFYKSLMVEADGLLLFCWKKMQSF